MKHFKLALAATAASMAMAGAAHADTTWAFNVGGASDYVFRGIDQTYDFSGSGDSGFEVFGGIDVSSGIFYAGTWLSNTGPNDENGVEYDLYAGVKPSAMGINWDLGLIFYGYNDSNGGTVTSAANTLEIKAAGSVPVGSATLGAAVYYSPEFALSNEPAYYIEANAAYTFENKATISGAVGHQFLDSGFYGVDGYTTWNLGVTYPVTDHVTIDARYIDADSDAGALGGNAAVDGKAVVTLKAAF